jgi:hypothetical protein
MKDRLVTDVLARRFLLGHVDNAERQEIESLFIADSEVKNTILLAEEVLIEDYLEGTLTGSDAAEFLLRYAQTPYQRRRLRITGSVKQYALAQSLAIEKAHSGVQKFWTSLRSTFDHRYFIPATVAATIILLVGSIWLAQWHNRGTQEDNQRLIFCQQLTALNSRASLSETPPQMFSQTLLPGAVRSAQPSSEVNLQTNYSVIELQLLWPQREEYQSYQATLRRVGIAVRFPIPDLHLEKKSERNIVRLRLPASQISPGLYQISLNGIASDGTVASTEEYTFSVTR